METNNINQFIKKSLEYYDNQQLKYKNLIVSENVEFSKTSNEITFINKKDEERINADIELLGYFDHQNKIWIWSWLLSDLQSSLTKTARELLNYGLKLEPNNNTEEHIFIKSLLVNSRITIEEKVQLDINLGIYSYLSRDKYQFIYPHNKYDKNNIAYTYYYLIKK
jgi:hypothetical protein